MGNEQDYEEGLNDLEAAIFRELLSDCRIAGIQLPPEDLALARGLSRLFAAGLSDDERTALDRIIAKRADFAALAFPLLPVT